MVHGQFERQTKIARNFPRLEWLKNGTLKRDRESLYAHLRNNLFELMSSKGRLTNVERKLNL